MTEDPDRSRVGGSDTVLLPSPSRGRGALLPGPSPRKEGHIDNPFPPRDDARPALKRSLGVLKISILVGGTLAIFAIVGFMTFVWKSANDAVVETLPSSASAAATWRGLLDSGWLLQVVTASTVLIRFVAGLQVGVMTQMLSALVLECGRCSFKEDLAPLSLTRAETSGPFGGVTFAIWRQRGPANRVFGILLFLLLVVAGAIQFSSTLLVTDIGPAKVLGGYSTSNISAAWRRKVPYNMEEGNYWRSRAPAYSRFAEDPGSAVQGEDYYDTGTTFRAFLPLDSSSQRMAIRSYAGVASTFDARVACVRPRLTVTGCNKTYTTLGFEGNISWTNGYEGVQRYSPDSPFSGSFSCIVADAGDLDGPPQARIFMCPVGDRVGFLLDGKMRPDSTYNASGTTSLRGYADGYLFINLTAPSQFWAPRIGANTSTGMPFFNGTTLAESTSSGVWQSLSLDGGSSNVGVDVTLCFINAVDRTYQITAGSTRDGQEPSPRRNIKTGEYGGEAVRDFLGATLHRRAPEDRGVLRLRSRPANWLAVSADETLSTGGFSYIWSAVRPPSSRTISLNILTYPQWSLLVPHRGHVDLSQDIIAHTGNNAALALQAIFTTLIQMAYYDYLAESDVDATTTTVFFPGRRDPAPVDRLL